MILAAQEVFVLRQLDGNTDLVARGAKLRALVQRFQEGLLVEIGLRLDERLVDELKHAVGAESEWIMDRLIDRIVCIAARAVDMIDCVAGGTGDARL